jgi:putative phosphoesterase
VRVAALYDIHGNLPALEAVLRDVRGSDVDEIVVGGDVVPGPMPRECLQELRRAKIPTQFISGNGEREVLAARTGISSPLLPNRARVAIRWTAEQLDEVTVRAIGSWPGALHLTFDSLGEVHFCHASPRNDTDIVTRLTPENRVRSLLASAHARVVVCGHTHIQFDRTVGDTRLVNAGSVGMPFQSPGAYWLLIGDTIELRHTEYDRADAAARIRRTRYPHAAEFADRNVLDPPKEDEMLAVYSRVQLPVT